MLAVLAAGRGERFDSATHKLNAPLTIAGRTLTVAQHSIEHALATGLTTIVVTGAVDVELGALAHHPNLVVGHNPAWATGQASSVAFAVDTATTMGADALVIGLADQPLVTTESWAAVAAATSPIAVATYAGQRRNPVRLDRSVWPEVPRVGDVGARLLIALLPDRVEDVPCSGSAFDIDTVEDLEDLKIWQSKSSTSSR